MLPPMEEKKPLGTKRSDFQISGNPEFRKIRISGNPDLRNSDLPVFQKSGFPEIRNGFFLPPGASENLIKFDSSVAPDGRKKATRKQTARFADFWNSGKSGFQEIRISGIPNCRFFGNPDFRKYGVAFSSVGSD